MKFVFSIVFLCVAFGAYSQIDVQEFTVPNELKNPLETPMDQPNQPYQPQSIPSLTNPEYLHGMEGMVNDVDSYFKKKEKPLNLTTDNGLRTHTVDVTPNYLKEFKNEGVGNTEPQFLGEYIVDSKFVEVFCRDHEYVDGDRVRVYVNGNIVAQQITLRGNFQPVLVNLKKGKNIIEFEALNEGKSSPNTAEFMVYDDMGRVVAHNRWNLSTGVKASFVVIKK